MKTTTTATATDAEVTAAAIASANSISPTGLRECIRTVRRQIQREAQSHRDMRRRGQTPRGVDCGGGEVRYWIDVLWDRRKELLREFLAMDSGDSLRSEYGYRYDRGW